MKKRIEFIRATLPRESADRYEPGQKAEVDAASAERWIRRGAARYVQTRKAEAAKPSGKQKKG